jgi:hypothetical protein
MASIFDASLLNNLRTNKCLTVLNIVNYLCSVKVNFYCVVYRIVSSAVVVLQYDKEESRTGKINGAWRLCPLCTSVSTYLLTPWSRVLLEKLTGSQLVKKFPHFM